MLVALFVLAFALALAEDGARAWRADHAEPSLGARWIWADGVADAGEPVAFWLVRDVVIDRACSTEEPCPAWLSIAADEEYALHVNGRRVGAGVHRPEASADLYDLRDDLETGTNRILVEVRSSRGAGGLLASLRLDDPERAVVVTDESWRVMRRADPRVFGGSVYLDDPAVAESLEVPKTWSRPPAGRWRPKPPEAKPSELVYWPPPEIHRPRRVRGAAAGTAWREIDPSNAPSLETPIPGGAQAIYDFGRPVQGFLEIDLDSQAPAEDLPRLLFFADDAPPMPAERSADAVAVPVPGGGDWRDARPRRFRYVAVIGPGAITDLRVEAVSDDRYAALAPPPAPSDGVFGLPAIHGVSHAEEWVRKRLPRR